MTLRRKGGESVRRKKRPEEEAEEYTFDQDYDEGYAPETLDEYEPEDGEPGVPPESARKNPGKKKKGSGLFRPSLRKPNFVLSVAVGVVRVALLAVLLAGAAGLGALLGIAKGYVETAPELDLAALDGQAQTSFIYDCNGELITEYKGTENRVMVSLAAMPLNLRNAFVAVEDARFYSHNGVDVIRIGGAFINNIVSSGTQGGSTITQQLIKNTLLSPERSYKRKIQEAWLAMQLEARYSKDQILESYLNTIYLGENYYGVQVAAEGYFGKSLGELTLRECAMLAGATNNPYYYNPRRNLYTRKSDTTDYAAVTNNRTDYVLRCMYENRFITWSQYQEALNPETAHVLETSPKSGDAMYPYAHYVEYAVDEVVDIFLELGGLENTPANRAAMETKLRTGGYRVKLAIDPNIQQTVQDTLTEWDRYPGMRDPADKVFRSRNSDGTYTEIVQPQAACAVLDYRTGELKAIVGSRSPVTARKTLNRATDMKMPVGSAIKPIAVYAPALELGASPATIAYNMPLPLPGWKDARGNDSWPTNYGGGGYVGPETLRTAMNKSHNTAAAYTLLYRVGVERSVDFLHRMGVDDDHIDATPFGLSLGSSGITPLQMTVAYGVLANGGVYQEPISVLGISDSNGDVVWDGHQHQERRRVFSDSTSWMIVDMLKTVLSAGTSRSAQIKGQVAGGKTGTNSDQKGVFFAGITGYYSSALWVGHDNYKALSSKSTGSASAVPLWGAYMTKIHQGLPKKQILDGNASDYHVTRVETCAVSGQLATEACRHDAMGYGTVTDYWAAGTEPKVYCQMHVTETVCSETGMLASPWCPNPVQRGVISIPAGHPLYAFIGSKYQGVLEEYLGTAAASSGVMCTYHNANTPVSGVSATTAALIADARLLLSSAEALLQTLDPASAQWQAVSRAASVLAGVIAKETPTQSEVAAAMADLTQAMAGIY